MGDRNFNYLSDMNSAQPTKGLFVGDLSSSTTERDLQALFGRFGQVVAVEVKRGRHGDSLLHGFVEFDSESSAFTAIQALNGIKFKSRKMRVNWTNTKFTPTLEAESWIQVQVNFSSKNTTSHVNEELFETIFSQFGKIADVMVKRQILSSGPVQLSGYGFVFFLELSSALNAVAIVKNISIDGIIYECVLGAQKKEEKKAPSPPAASPVHVFDQHQHGIGNRDYHHVAAIPKGRNNNNNRYSHFHHHAPSPSFPYSDHQQQAQRVISHGSASIAEKHHPHYANRGMFPTPSLERVDQPSHNQYHDSAPMPNRIAQQQLHLQQRSMFSDRLSPSMKGKIMSSSYPEQLLMQQREEKLFARETRARAISEQVYPKVHDMNSRNNVPGKATGQTGLWTNEFNPGPSPFWQDGASTRAQPPERDFMPESNRFPGQSSSHSLAQASMGMTSIFTEEGNFYANQGQRNNLLADSKSSLFPAGHLDSSFTSVATYFRSSPTFSEGRNSLNNFGQGNGYLFDNETNLQFSGSTNIPAPFLNLSTANLKEATLEKSLLPNGFLDLDRSSGPSLLESLSSSRSSDRWTLGGF